VGDVAVAEGGVASVAVGVVMVIEEAVLMIWEAAQDRLAVEVVVVVTGEAVTEVLAVPTGAVVASAVIDEVVETEEVDLAIGENHAWSSREILLRPATTGSFTLPLVSYTCPGFQKQKRDLNGRAWVTG
jgi:hypothetical protein